MLPARHGEKFLAHRTSPSPPPSRPSARRSLRYATRHACRDPRQHAVRESWLHIRLEDHGRNPVQPRRQASSARKRTRPRQTPHRTDAGARFSPNPTVPRGSIAALRRNFVAADSLQPRHADRFQRQSGLRHQFRFHPALGSHDHDASSPSGSRRAILAPPPWPEKHARRCRRPQSVNFGSAGASRTALAARRCRCAHVSSACWLIFNSTPVANSIPIRLDPP